MFYFVWFLHYLLFVTVSFAFPIEEDYVLTTSTENYNNNRNNSKESSKIKFEPPKIYEMNIIANITNRFSHTCIISKMKNSDDTAKEAIFTIIIPETAYITRFMFEIDGKNYTAELKEKLEARYIYAKATYTGKSAGLLETTVRNSNKFTVSLTIEPSSKATFYVIYEELLKRKEFYEIVLNIFPRQIVKNLNVEAHIFETKPLKFVRTAPIRSGNEITGTDENLDSRAKIRQIDDFSCLVRFNPDETRQKELANSLKTDEEEGLAGQFIVQYDIERNYDGGEVLLKDGYFVHFFAPSEIESLPKHVVFVLDTSGSMMFQKIDQLKEAMKNIFLQIGEDDIFHIVEFNNDVNVWNITDPSRNVRFPRYKNNDIWFADRQNFPIQNTSFPSASHPNENILLNTFQQLNEMDANGGTNIYESLRVALRLVEIEKLNNSDYSHQPIIMFLTDGEPTVGVTDADIIIQKILELNYFRTPIFSLCFGDGADREFLKKLSLHNYGFSRFIYEAADAALQLENFFKDISSPLLRNVRFRYTQEVHNLTKTVFPIYFNGGEVVISGVYDDIDEFKKNAVKVSAWGVQGPVTLRPNFEEPTGELERLWAYLTIQQLLEKIKVSPDQVKLQEKIEELSLKYSFVTPFTSLVVVKKNEEELRISSEITSEREDNDGFITAGKPIQYSIDDVSGIMDFKSQQSTSTPFTRSFATLDLINNYSWFVTILHKDSDTVTIPKGSFKIGTLNATYLNASSCPSSLIQGTALQCVLLQSCTTMYNILKTLEDYNTYFCSFDNTFAGVCCPR